MPRIENEVKLDFKDVLLRPKRSTLKSRNDVVLEKEYRFRHAKHTYTGIPVVASNMDTVGTFEMAAAIAPLGLFTCIHKHYSVQQWTDFAAQHHNVLPHVAVSTGISETEFAKLREITTAVPGVHFVCLDVANGYSEHFVQFIAKVRSALPYHVIIAGNVVTGEMVEQLILSGADIVKVGIGPGSVCTTRAKAGVGYPQLSAVMECADAAHGLGGHVIADGGCACPGDIAKAFGGGADFVMVGGMLAGHDQSGGDLVVKADGSQTKLFYGMASATAMHKYHGAVNNYRASEGKTVEVPYRGDVSVTVQDILGGLRSACTYTGSITLKELPKVPSVHAHRKPRGRMRIERTTFIRVSQTTNEVFAPFNVQCKKPKPS